MRVLWRDYTTVLVLVGLCVLLSAVTWRKQFASGASGGSQLAALIQRQSPAGAAVLIVVRDTEEDAEFATALKERLEVSGLRVVEVVQGQPTDARRAIRRASDAEIPIDWIAATEATAAWGLFHDLPGIGAATKNARLIAPPSYYGPTFLKL